MDVVVLRHEAARAELGGVDWPRVEEDGARHAHAAAARPDGLLPGEDAQQRALRGKSEERGGYDSAERDEHTGKDLMPQETSGERRLRGESARTFPQPEGPTTAVISPMTHAPDTSSRMVRPGAAPRPKKPLRRARRRDTTHMN